MRSTLPILIVAASCLAGAAAQETVREGKQEVLCLDGLAAPARWGPAECTVAASEKPEPGGHATVHMHIPVDHHAGEKRYPIGWPRMYLNLKQTEKGWEKFERFEFMAHATMSRPTPPKNIINLQIHCPGKPHVFNRNLAEIRLGEWVRITVPIRALPRAGQAGRLGFNISESDYRHGETLEFRFGGFRLVRSAEFVLEALTIRSAVVYQGQPRVKVELAVGGPPLKIARGLPLTLRHGERVLRQETLPVKAGLQVLEVDVAELKLAPGDYTLAAFDSDPERRKSGAFRVVETPWKGH